MARREIRLDFFNRLVGLDGAKMYEYRTIVKGIEVPLNDKENSTFYVFLSTYEYGKNKLFHFSEKGAHI